MMRSTHPVRAPVLACTLLLLSAAGCGHNKPDDFPLAVGFQPLEPVTAAALLPAAAGNEPYPQGLGDVVAVPGDGHYVSHARGYLHAPLDKVYLALQDPASSLIHNDSSGPRLDNVPGNPFMKEEPFPVSFRVRYSNSTVIGDVKFDVTYRAGPLEGTELAPLQVGQRYQKTWGTSHIRVMSGSLVATPLAADPNVTVVELVAWLNADTQYQSDCDGTLRDLFGDLEGVLAAPPP
jgi:hypothetical protein